MDATSPVRVARPPLDGRWATALILLLYAALLGALVHASDVVSAWRVLGVPGLPYFADLRGITSAADSWRLGYDPLVRNPENPYDGTPMNYPRLWLQAALVLHLHQRDTEWLGCVLAAAFFGGVLLFIGRVGLRQGVCWGLFLCLPPVMLAVERGNNDLVVFLLLAGALLALRRQGEPGWSAYALIFIAAILKLFPVVALLLAGREKPRRALTILGVAAAAFTAYLYAVRADLRAIHAAVPRALNYAYGCRVYFYGIADRYPTDVPWIGWTALAVALLVAVVALARCRWPGPAPLPRAETDALMVGGIVYVATFVVGSSYNYRLIMLLFTLPAWLHLANGGALAYRRLAVVLLWAMAVGWLCSAAMETTVAFFVKEAVNWAVCGGTLFLLLQQVPLPRWLATRMAVPSVDRPPLAAPITGLPIDGETKTLHGA